MAGVESNVKPIASPSPTRCRTDRYNRALSYSNNTSSSSSIFATVHPNFGSCACPPRDCFSRVRFCAASECNRLDDTGLFAFLVYGQFQQPPTGETGAKPRFGDWASFQAAWDDSPNDTIWCHQTSDHATDFDQTKRCARRIHAGNTPS